MKADIVHYPATPIKSDNTLTECSSTIQKPDLDTRSGVLHLIVKMLHCVTSACGARVINRTNSIQMLEVLLTLCSESAATS